MEEQKIPVKQKMRLTDEGDRVLSNMLDNLQNLMVNQRVPFQSRLLGFPMLLVQSRDELFGRIQMLREILAVEPRHGGDE